MSDRRARQAARTRDEILGAARALFAERGYANTSVKEVAARADVSVQTVYDSVGSKAELVRHLNDHIDAEAGIGQIAMTIPSIDASVAAMIEITMLFFIVSQTSSESSAVRRFAIP